MSSIQTLISEIIDEKNPVFALKPQMNELAQRLKKIVDIDKLLCDRIDEGETATNAGLAVSPTMAIMCADDYVRTVQFIRALHSAILDVNQLKPETPAQVLYAGTGPLAILAIPLMFILTEHQAKFILLDLHQVSIDSVEKIVNALKLNKSINAIEKIDAFNYQVDNNNPPDIIILEIMQACLAKEPQVAVSHHLIKQAPKAILIPQEIKIELIMVDSNNEFEFIGENKNKNKTRVRLGNALSINKEQLLGQTNKGKLALPAIAIQIPKTIPQHLDAKLFTTITTYKHHVLKEYDSGLTCPRAISCDQDFSLGDTLEFNYQITNQPELKVHVIN